MAYYKDKLKTAFYMKTNIYIITILLLFINNIGIKGQEDISTNLVLNQSLNPGTYNYSASQSINLIDGFQYTANADYKFLAFIDLYNLNPDPYPGNITGGSGGGIVGTIEGNFDVTPHGQATYEIPIKVPAGTGGIAPQLSIVYNSGSSDGWLGSKFDLAGFSMINRAPSNMHTDGLAGVVNFSASDHFMIDGQRLIYFKKIDDQTREYRTENNSFMKVIAKGSDTSNPTTFIAYTKDGLIYEYGSNNSQLKNQEQSSPVNLFWFVRKVSDTKGNYYTVSYDKDDNNGEYWPTRIDYTGNSNTGLVPYCSVRFDYLSNTSNATLTYIHGMKVRRSKRLNRIDIYSAENRVKYYQLNYIDSNNRKYQLSEVVEFAADGTKINPTKFGWGNASFIQSGGGLKRIDGFNRYNIRTGDFNGDGRMDMLLFTSDRFEVWTMTDSGFKLATSGGCGNGGTTIDIIVGDFNGDGCSDFVVKRRNSATYSLDMYISNISNGYVLNCYYQKTVHSGSIGLPIGYNVKAGDFNGDGATDLFIYYPANSIGKSNTGTVICSESTKSGITALNKNVQATGSFYWDRVEIVDFNGDGRAEIMNLHSDGHTIMETLPQELYFHEFVKTTWIKKDHHVHFGDFNGDGKTDMLLTGYSDGDHHWSTWQIHLSKGNNAFEIIDFPRLIDTKNKTIYVGDANGDGKDDIFAFDSKSSNSPRTSFIFINNGINLGQTTYFTRYNNNILDDVNTEKSSFYFGDFYGNGKVKYIWTYNGQSNDGIVYAGGGFSEEVNNMLTSITDGLGNNIAIEYKPMSDNSVHQKGFVNAYPMTSFSSSIPLVSKVEQSNGIGGKSVISYKYKNALAHKRGRGLLGFEYFTTKNETNETETTTQMEVNRDQYVMGVKSVETKVAGKLVSQVDYTNQLKYYNSSEVTNKIFTYDVISTVEKKYEINTSKLYSTVTSTAEYDNYGNVTKSVVKYSSSDIITNINTFTNDESKWHLGRLTKAVVTKTKGQENVTRTSQFAYDPVSGILNKEIVEPGNNKLGYVKAYQHDAYGNILVSTTTPNDIRFKPRIQKSEYDTKGRFEIKSIIVNDGQELVTQRNINHDLGIVNYEIDPNNLKTEYTYDSFGRLIFTKTPLGNVQTVVRWCQNHVDAPANAVYFTYSEKSGTPPVLEFFDRLGRSLRKVVYGFNGQKIYADIVYNAKGQVEKSSEPYFAGQTVYWNRSEYDAIGRTTKQIYTDGTYSEMIYDGLVTKTISPLRHQDTKKIDVLGQIVESIDNKGGKVTYKYNASGNCVEVTGPRTVVKSEFDIMGNRIKLDDPDLGIVESVYNSFGELISQTDSHGTKSFEYDNMGRVVKETTNDGITTYLYDTKWKGSLTQSKLNKNNISQTFDYDTFGRIKSITETIDDKSYTTYTSYDVYNRPDITTYPSGFKVQNEYNENGYLVKVKNPQNNVVYWHAKTMNTKGQMEQFTLGNNLTTTVKYNAQKGYITDIITPGIQNWSYQFNAVGNLTDRKDNIKGKTEHFDYDELNRLWQVSHNGVLNQEILYDAAGNVISKTGVGTYFKYKDGTNKLEYVMGSNYAPPSWDVITYTSFNKIAYVSQGANSLALTYGINKDRKKSVTLRDGYSETKYYIGSLYEEIYLNGGEIKKNHYIFAGGGAIAIREQSNKTGEKLRYLHKDHLGSVMAYSNETGGLVEELSYDAWGRRRNADTWEYISLTNAKIWHPRGFTGHEHLDIFEMINMNGRMYDPVLGRFLSPDPFVQAPDYTQGLNRYAYCLNNPLSLVDPSGYSWFSKHWKSLVSAVVGITVSALIPGAGIGYIMLAGAAGGAAAGLVGALLNGANLGQLARSTITGGFWGGMKASLANLSHSTDFLLRLTKHSLSQAFLEGAKGGNIIHGFMSGAASVAGGEISGKYGAKWSKAGKVAFNAALSGTVAELGGGKFANGAITGAYILLFNDLMHEKQKELEGLFNEAKKIVKAFLTGNPDSERISVVAIVNSLNADGQVFASSSGSFGMGMIFAGGDAGTIFGILNLGQGWGGVGFSVGSNSTIYIYAGNIENFSLDSFNGQQITFNLSVDKGLSVNAGITASHDRYGGYLIGITSGVGYGQSPLKINGYFNVADGCYAFPIRRIRIRK